MKGSDFPYEKEKHCTLIIGGKHQNILTTLGESGWILHFSIAVVFANSYLTPGFNPDDSLLQSEAKRGGHLRKTR